MVFGLVRPLRLGCDSTVELEPASVLTEIVDRFWMQEIEVVSLDAERSHRSDITAL
jgi:hypothetical protein